MLCYLKKLYGRTSLRKSKALWTEDFRRRKKQLAFLLLGDLQGVAAHFPFDANEKIEVHAFGF
jgi:hypothetical protein